MASSSQRQVSTSHVKKLLDSRNDREKLEGLRTVIAVWQRTLTISVRKTKEQEERITDRLSVELVYV